MLVFGGIYDAEAGGALPEAEQGEGTNRRRRTGSQFAVRLKTVSLLDVYDETSG